jgi:cell division protein FtsZ
MTLHEANEAAEIIRERVDGDANIRFGAVLNEAMGDEVQITVIATGFNADSRIQNRPFVVSPRKTLDFPVRSFEGEDLDIPSFLRRKQRPQQ